MGYEYPIMLDVGEIPVAMTLHESVDKAWGALFASPPGLVARPSRKVQLAPCRDVRASTSLRTRARMDVPSTVIRACLEGTPAPLPELSASDFVVQCSVRAGGGMIYAEGL